MWPRDDPAANGRLAGRRRGRTGAILPATESLAPPLDNLLDALEDVPRRRHAADRCDELTISLRGICMTCANLR